MKETLSIAEREKERAMAMAMGGMQQNKKRVSLIFRTEGSTLMSGWLANWRTLVVVVVVASLFVDNDIRLLFSISLLRSLDSHFTTHLTICVCTADLSFLFLVRRCSRP